MKEQLLNVLGTMSGTSLDGIDMSCIKTDGMKINLTNENFFVKYSKKTTDLLYDTLNLNEKIFNNFNLLNKLNKIVTIEYAQAIKNLPVFKKINLIGFHGQTIFHNPKKKISFQLGDGQLLANLLSKNVIFNFRSNDLENGGQGAPLAPIYHQIIINKIKTQLPSCFINIGGVSNLTYWDGKELMGFDTGPGNGIMDSFMRKNFKVNYDKFGKIASSGKVDKNIIDLLMKNKYFNIKPPKSLDRQYFFDFFLNLISKKIDPYDVMATLLEFTAFSLIDSFKFLPKYPKTLIFSGGGLKNYTLMKRIQALTKCKLIKLEDHGFSPDFIEAELIGFLAARSLKNLPITFPGTTGVSNPLTGGVLYKNYKNP